MSEGLACKHCHGYVRGDWAYCEKDGDAFIKTIEERGYAFQDAINTTLRERNDAIKERDALRERVERYREVLEEVALPPYHDSDLKSLLETLAARAKAALAIPEGER